MYLQNPSYPQKSFLKFADYLIIFIDTEKIGWVFVDIFAQSKNFKN